MMRSLWSGVSGLQSHQVAMDVESNNIANVNTVGFKYSRANFSDQFSQTARPATAPEGELGGRNAMQIGLGTQVVATQQIFSQGSLETTDSNTDLAIQGNGFFVVSPDGGLTKYYTRNGQFTRDSLGNFVDNNGYIVQGWMRDEETNTIDPTAPVENIVIEPGLSIPANATTEVSYKGNLDSGTEVGSQSSPIYSLDHNSGWLDKNGNKILDNTKTGAGVEIFSSTVEGSSENDTSHDEFFTDDKGNVKMRERGVDMSVVFDDTGTALSLRKGQGMWVSYADARLTLGGPNNAQGNPGGVDIGAQTAQDGTVTPGKLRLNINGVSVQADVKTIAEVVEAINSVQLTTGVAASIVNNNQIQLINQNGTGTTATAKNIKLSAEAGNTVKFDEASKDKPEEFNSAVITAYQYTYSEISVAHTPSYDDTDAREFNTTEDLREAMQRDARLYTNYNGTSIEYVIPQGGTTPSAVADWGNTEAWNADGKSMLNKNDGVQVTINAQGQFEISNPANDAFNDNDYGTQTTTNQGTTYAPNAQGDAVDNFTEVTIDGQKTTMYEKYKNANTAADDQNMNIRVTNLTSDGVNANSRMRDVFANLEGGLSIGSSSNKQSAALKMASHSMTTEVYDSLGSKHELAIEFRKVGYSAENGTEWSITVRVPEPAVINSDPNATYKNIITGSIRFKNDGSVLGYSPSTITLTANNGSGAGQSIALNFGTLGGFDGMRSYDAKSSTDDIKQDGYTGGVLNDMRVDENGKIIGSFTNGHSLALAQVSMATFTNNNGLENLGGNVFGETANSGTPVIGAANTGARGKISGGALEMSNVDLSRAFTQLIVIQRGYQANSKTITTSDTMLNTLLQLKQ